MDTVRQSLSRLYTQLLLSCLKPKVGNSTHSDERNARESLSNVWLPNLLLFKIKKEINKFEESISTQSHLAYNVLNLTGNWECCFLKRRGETGLPRKKPLRDPHVVSPTGFTNPSHTGGGWGGDVNALTTSPKHFSEVLNYSYLCSNHKLRPSWKCDHAIPKGQCAGIGIWLAG